MEEEKVCLHNLILNPDKTTCTVFMPDHAEYLSNLDITINNRLQPPSNQIWQAMTCIYEMARY